MIDRVLHHSRELVIVMHDWMIDHFLMSMHMVVDWLLLNNGDFMLDIAIPMARGMLRQGIWIVRVVVTMVIETMIIEAHESM